MSAKSAQEWNPQKELDNFKNFMSNIQIKPKSTRAINCYRCRNSGWNTVAIQSHLQNASQKWEVYHII